MGPQIRSRKETSVEIRKLVISLSNEGKSYRRITEIIGKSRSCVQKIVGRF